MNIDQLRRAFSMEPTEEDIDWCVHRTIAFMRDGVPLEEAVEKAVRQRERLKRDMADLEYQKARARYEREKKLREEGKPTLEHKSFAGLMQQLRKGRSDG